MSLKTGFESLSIVDFRFSHIAPVFNLIQAGSVSGCFSNLYLDPRFQAGLALQLFSVRLFSKIRLPSGVWHRARVHVLLHDGAFAGFLLMRHVVSSGANQEIYMCAISVQFRGNGFGKWLLRSVLAHLPANVTVDAGCLSSAVSMQKLLRRIGFKSAGFIESFDRQNRVKKFCFFTGVNSII